MPSTFAHIDGKLHYLSQHKPTKFMCRCSSTFAIEVFAFCDQNESFESLAIPGKHCFSLLHSLSLQPATQHFCSVFVLSAGEKKSVFCIASHCILNLFVLFGTGLCSNKPVDQPTSQPARPDDDVQIFGQTKMRINCSHKNRVCIRTSIVCSRIVPCYMVWSLSFSWKI